jgi:TRAP-type mannitol/chloroaromatic compound transport system permease small subunit
MDAALAVAHGIDRINGWWGRIAVWAMFISCMVSAGNATVRYLINLSSNAWLEIQWYLFGVCVLMGAAAVLRVNEHVRVDVMYSRYSGRLKAWVDLLGIIFFLMPATALLVWMSWPWFLDSWRLMEHSSNEGGLIRWPVKILLPVGFFFLTLQGASEIIKRIGFLRGVYAMDTHYERPLQ